MARNRMPNPVLVGSTWYLRINTPADVRSEVQGTTISVPVDGVFHAVKVKDAVKVSLRTKDLTEAKRRFAGAYAAIEEHWAAVRSGPEPLTHKQSLALAGALRAAWVGIFDEDPGTVEMWSNVQEVDEAALEGRLSMPMVGPEDLTVSASFESRFGKMTDGFLRAKGVLVAKESRPRLLRHVADAMMDASRVNMAKAQGDYSDDGTTNKYPDYEATPSGTNASKAGQSPATEKETISFGSVIDKWVEEKSKGRDAVPPRPSTVSKFKRAAQEFAAFRDSDEVSTVTAIEARDWMYSMLDAEVLANNTIKQRIQNLRTVVNRARVQNLGELFPYGDPLEMVELPAYASIPSDQRTVTLQEAKTILKAARSQKNPDRRWLPWLCAYSGARINEVAQLTPDALFEVDGNWFFKLTTMGGKSLKNFNSERRVPVHPDLISEGLLDFVEKCAASGPTGAMFPKRAGSNVRDWIRDGLGLTRKELAPNHGWRHLFADMATVAQMTDRARNYITGRADSGSDAGYGFSEAMLPGLAEQMNKIGSYLD